MLKASPTLAGGLHTTKKDPRLMPMGGFLRKTKINELPMMRKFKSYVGLPTAFSKFQKLLTDFEFVSVKDADRLIDWKTVRQIQL